MPGGYLDPGLRRHPGRGLFLAGLTTIEKPGRQIGVRAVECLLDQIAGRHQRERIYLPCRLVERGSLADVSGAATVRMAAGR